MNHLNETCKSHAKFWPETRKTNGDIGPQTNIYRETLFYNT